MNEAIGDRYQLVRKLGQGATAEVYLVRDRLRQGLPLALKLLRDRAHAAWLAREFEVLAPLRHPNLAAIHDAELSADCAQPHITFDYVEGPDLAAWGRDRSQRHILGALAGVLRALCLLHHRGWTHGDVKPANVLVDARGEAKLLDLGMAAAAGGSSGGTPGYTAPEILSGGQATPRSDLYSFGVLALEVLTGSAVFSPDPAAAVEQQLADRSVATPDLDPELGALLRGCLAREPSARPESAEALLRAVESVTGLDLSPDLSRLELLPQPALVGRSGPLAACERCLTRTAEGQGPALVVVGGAAGMGKTRLLAEIRHLALRRGYRCHCARSLRELLGALGARHPLSPRAALFRLGAAAARSRPTALLLDDHHLDDATATDALAGLAVALAEPDAQTTSLPLLVVVAGEPAPDVPAHVSLHLDALSEEHSLALLRSMLPGVPVTGETLRAVARMAAGSPWLLVETLLLHLRSGEDGAAAAYPERVRQVARRRLSGVTGAQREALRLLALADELEPALLPAGPEAIRALIDRRLALERARPGSVTLVLGGEHLREALLADLPQERRAALHAGLAAGLRDAGGHPARIGAHLARAGRAAEAADAYLEAARGAERAAGAGWAARAVELGGEAWAGWAEATRRLASSRAAAGDPRAAAEALEALVDAGHADDHDRVTLAGLLATLNEGARALALLDGQSSREAQLIRARVHLAAQQLDEALAICRALPDQGAAANIEGLALYARGALQEATASLERAESLHTAEHDLEGLAKVANNLGLVQQARGNLDAARTWYRTARRRTRELGDDLRAVHCQLNHGTVCQLSGQYEQARTDYEQAVFDARRLGDEGLAVSARMNLATLLMELGAESDAARELERCRPTGARQAAYLLLYRAELAARSQELDGAARLLDEARERQQGQGDPTLATDTLLVEARVALATGRNQDAATLADRAAGLAAELGYGRLEDEARLLRVRARRRLPHTDVGGLRAPLAEIVLRMEQRGERGRLWQAYHELHTVESLLGMEVDADYHLAKTRHHLDAVLDALPERLRTTMLGRPALREAYAATRLERRPGAVPPAAGAGQGHVAADALLRLNLELGRVRDPEQLVVLILDKAIELTGAQRGVVILVEGDDLRIAAARNVDQETLRRGKEKFSKSLAREVLASGRSLLSVNARDDRRLERFESVHAMKLRSVVCAPIRAWGTIVGVIYLDNRFRPGAFTEEHLALLEGYGAQAGIALDTARLLQREREQNRELARVKAEVEALGRRLQQSLDEQALDLEKARRMVTAQRRELSKGAAFAGIIGRSRAIERVLELVRRTADSEIPVYIFGESGTGKELVARAIHRASPRREAPLVTLNCGGLSPQLLASELFGHVRGAFTGASRDHPGLVRMAEGGTLFLDEVSEMSPELQVQLLRVLQTGDFRPVGGDEELHADVRVVSASNLDLEQCVARGAFREDLFYRLNVLRIDLPPLRERREDIPLLIQHFLGAQSIQRAAVALLLEYPWPGNVRELQNELERARALGGDEVTVQDLSPKIVGASAAPRESAPGGTLSSRVALCERETIAEALERTGGNLSRAARELGLSRGGLYKKMAAHGLARPRRS